METPNTSERRKHQLWKAPALVREGSISPWKVPALVQEGSISRWKGAALVFEESINQHRVFAAV